MADISRVDAMLSKQGRFKRKDAQHVIDALADFFNTVCAPCPNGWAHEVHGRHTRRFEVARQVQIKVRGINANEGVWTISQQTRFELLTDANDFAVVP